MNGQGESDVSYDDIIIMQLGGEGDLSKSHLQDDNNLDNCLTVLTLTAICIVELQAQLKLSVVHTVIFLNCILHSLNHT